MKLEYEKIKQLIEDIGNSKLTSVDIDFPDGTKISMKKEVTQVVTAVDTTKIDNKNLKALGKEITYKESEKEKIDENLKVIKSPMVGTFYLKPSPTSEPFCKIGKKVNKGDVVCIIEAMKLMNEIESEFDGEIAEIYIKDGEVVEYGTKLFAIK